VTDANVKPNGGELVGTSSTLLVRIKAKEQAAWGRFVQLYSPLVYRWCLQFGLQEADVADVGQDVFATVAASIDGFQGDRKGDSFRGWLRTITRSRVIDFLRKKARSANAEGGSEAQARMLEIPDSESDAGSDADDEGDRSILVRRAVELVLSRCRDETRQVFSRVVVGGEPPADVARDLGMTANAVYLAKSHVLRKIKEELARSIDL
jgi:RNA polymerase sigma-70 factor (ECF subfamily)